jgi:dienelactone hydrolase
MRLITVLALVGLVHAVPALAKLHTETVEYKIGNDTFEGYLVYDQAVQGARPGVLIFHEWMGPQSYERMRAEQLAKLGYVAFVPDIYGKGVRPSTPQEAGEQTGKYRNNRPLMRERAKAGLDQLLKSNLIDPTRIAAIGYCFGGTVALELARSGADIAGAVSFHGTPSTPNPDDGKNIKARILVLHGAADPNVSAEALTSFRNEMDAAHVDWQLVMYGGAVHGFSNPKNTGDPSTGVAYNKDADLRSWEDMRQFFDEIFKR